MKEPCFFEIETPEIDFDGPLGTDLLARLPKTATKRATRGDGLQSSERSYAREDLFALAEIAYHYLFSGSARIAQVFFEGLAAIAPDEAYFALALGLTYDRLDRPRDAAVAYERATVLDPRDPRPELNLAELALALGDHQAAHKRLEIAAQKAKRSGDDVLLTKAVALLERVRVVARGRR